MPDLRAGSPPNPRSGAPDIFPSRGMGTFQRLRTKPKVSPYELTETAFDQRDVKKTVRLYHESVGYENLANQKFVVDQARAAVKASLKDVFNVMEFLRNKWLVLYRLYRGETLDQFQYGRQRLHSPEPFKIVETLHPRLLRLLFGDQRWFRLYGESGDPDANAEAQERLCHDQLRRCRFLSKASTFLRNGLIYGTAVQKTYWKQEAGEVRFRTGKRVPDERFPGAHKVELSEIKSEQQLIFDGNDIENVEIFDFMTSPNASSVADAEWCADRSAWPDWKVKQMGELGYWTNLQPLRDHPGSNDISFGDEFKERKSYAYGVFDPREGSRAPHIPHYMVVDWWGPLVIEQKNGAYETRECNVVMIEPDGPEIIARVTVNPFWHQQKPYQVWRPINLEDEFYGIGALEMVARLSMEKDIKRNLLMSAAQLEANPMWLLSDEANIPDGQLLLQPGLTLRVPDPSNSVVPLQVPQVSDSALKAENVLTRDIRETAGTTSPSMGAQDPFSKSKTATQHMAEIDEANSRLVPMVLTYEQDVQIPQLDQMTWNNQQFQSYPAVIREIGALGKRFQDRYMITPEQLLGRFIVQPLASHKLATKQTQVQQLVNILDRAPVINQMYGPHAVKMTKLLAMILEQGFDIRNTDEFITIPPEEAGLLAASEEHELWYHGNVPPRKPDDNDMRHILNHTEEFSTPRFAELERIAPGIAAQARAHNAEHMRKLMLQQELQEAMLMKMAQFGSMNQAMGGRNIPGAAAPGQQPGSPQIRRNENERGERPGGQEQSEAMVAAPNAGAQ